jgi:L-ascorbate metabolism protein UlaG (beta-lactamase superfamily)
VSDAIGRERHQLAIGAVGGSTAVIDYGGARFVSDPTFDPPGSYGAYDKIAGPAVIPAAILPVDAVLLSHDTHMDNFDRAGREFAAEVGTVVTGWQAGQRMGDIARGLRPFESTVFGSAAPEIADVTVYAVPAQHGPADGERDEDGNINAETTGFVLQSAGLPTVYVSGDNASIAPVVEIADRFPDISIGVLHVGAARLSTKNAGRPLTLTADRASDVAELLGLSAVVLVHCEGWSLYTQTREDVHDAFADAGLASLIRSAPLGHWAIGGDRVAE